MSFTEARIVSIDTDPKYYFRQEHERGTPGFIMSASELKMFGECPDEYIHGYNPEQTDAMGGGSLLDCRLLTPKQFDSRFSIQPEKYLSEQMECPTCKSITDSKKCRTCGVDRVKKLIEKDWSNASNTCVEWVADQKGKTIVEKSDVEKCDAAIKRLTGKQAIADFVGQSQKQVHLAGKWKDEATGLVIPIRAMLDMVPLLDSEFHQSLGDLKRTRSVNKRLWKLDCLRMKHYLQAAFYRDFYLHAIGEGDTLKRVVDEEFTSRKEFCFILSASYHPWQPGKRFLGPNFLQQGRSEYETLLAGYCACVHFKKWPDEDETDESSGGWTQVEMEPWMETQFAFEPKFDFPKAAEVETAPFVSEEPT